MKCLSLSILFTFLKDQEDSDEHAKTYAHLSEGCPVCHENLQWLALVIKTTAEDKSFEFSEETIAALVARLKEQAAPAQRLIRQYIARLIFDTGVLPQPAYGRLTKEEFVIRHALYRAEGYDIDLRFELSYETNDEQLIGRVLWKRQDATKIVNFMVELLQDGSLISATNTNLRGTFKFENLMLKSYDMKISIPEGEINLERVQTARSV
jgi:hypothetical protein